MTMQANYARLDENSLAKLRQLEDETGAILVAFDPQSPFAELSEEQLQRIQQMEKEMGVMLVAYRSRRKRREQNA